MKKTLTRFIADRVDRTAFTGLPLTALVLLGAILLAGFAGIANSIVDSAPIVMIDTHFTAWLFSHRSATLAHELYLVTHVADQLVIAVLFVLVSLYLIAKKEFVYFFAFLIDVAGAELSVYLFKLFISRARPDASIAYYIEQTKSFPSGHATISIAFYGFIMYFVLRQIAKQNEWRLPIILLGSFLIAAVGFSRIYLGVHYLSDVLGGYLIGGLWLIIAIAFREQNLYKQSLKQALS